MIKAFRNHSKWWSQRKIDWNESYLSTANHPHRDIIVQVLKTFQWRSLWEIGCASGPNLLKIHANFPNVELGGNDLNADAIELAKKTFKGGIFEVSSADEICMSDKACDVILTDVTLIYVGPTKIKKTLREFKRMARNRIILVEFNSTSWWKRLKLRVMDGYFAHNYKKLLTELDFFDIIITKIPVKYYPGAGSNHKDFISLITART